MRAASLLLALLGFGLAACRSEGGSAPLASAAPAEAPVPASLLAELSLGNPQETWRRLRLLGGAGAEALPVSLPLLLLTSLSLPPSAAGSIDGALPMVGVLLSGPEGQPDAVVGIHVTSGAELVATLSLGASAKFRAKSLGTSLIELEPVPSTDPVRPAGVLGVSGNYLLVATRGEALVAAGRFVAQSVARRARAEPGLGVRASERVLARSVAGTLREVWRARQRSLAERAQAQRETKGRPADFADPEALLAGADNMVESFLGVLESSREISLGVTAEEDRLRLELVLVPGQEGAAALLANELVVGPLSPLLDLPERAQFALAFRGDDSVGVGANGGMGASFARLFGERLSPEQTARIVKAFEGLRGSCQGAGVLGLITEPEPILLSTCELAPPGGFSGAIAEVLTLLELPPIGAWLADSWGRPKLVLPAKSAVGPARARLRFVRSRPPLLAHGAGVNARSPLALPKELALAWEERSGVGYAAISTAADSGLGAFADARRLSSAPWLARTQQRLGAGVAFALFADAGLLGVSGMESAPLLLTFGKHGEGIVMGLEASPAALSALSKVFALGLR